MKLFLPISPSANSLLWLILCSRNRNEIIDLNEISNCCGWTVVKENVVQGSKSVLDLSEDFDYCPFLYCLACHMLGTSDFLWGSVRLVEQMAVSGY